MKIRTFKTLTIALTFFLIQVPEIFSCTSILVSAKASATGAPMISYSCDGEFHPHLRILPAGDFKPGEMVKIRNWSGKEFEIPQVPHTYRVVGLMNEHQLAIGETTFGGRKELINPDGLFHYYPLMLIALQRARTAREALSVMTSLVKKYGYASEGESISIADKKEAWLLEIVGTGKGGHGAAWVAMKIPEGMVCATANMSRIREFSLNDPENVLYSKNVVSLAIDRGYYNASDKKPFSFSAAYNPPTEEQIRYSARRIWSIFRRIAPKTNFSPEYSSGRSKAAPYPLWTRPDSKLGVRDVINLHRDHYEGTEFDMTRDVTAGPFGAPDRWRPIKWKVGHKTYSWERPIATQQAGFVYVSNARPELPDTVGGAIWYGPDNPYTSFFIPVYTSVRELPPSYTRGSLKRFSRDSAWWAFNFVANYANLRWSHMIKEIRSRQKEIEDLEFSLQEAIEKTAGSLARKNPELAQTFLTRYCISNAELNIQAWWELADHLVTRYNDGYIQNEKGRPREKGYPESWLRREIRKNGKRMRLTREKEINREL